MHISSSNLLLIHYYTSFSSVKVSIDALKKNLTPSYSKAGVRTLSTGSEVGGGASLLEFFELHFGEKGTQGYVLFLLFLLEFDFEFTIASF